MAGAGAIPDPVAFPREIFMSTATLGPLAAAARFVFGADHPTAKSLTEAAAGGTEADVKRAQALVKKLPAKDRTRLMAAFQTFSDAG
jgi:predicted TIM-barrel fold metal-dependent hydrolase